MTGRCVLSAARKLSFSLLSAECVSGGGGKVRYCFISGEVCIGAFLVTTSRYFIQFAF